MSGMGLSTVGKIESALMLLSLAIDIADKLIDALKKWGVLKDTSNTDELGAKALYAGDCGVLEENYATYRDYLHAVDGMDMTAEQRDAYALEKKREAGAHLILGGLREEMGAQAENFVIETAQNDDFYQEEGRVEAYAEAVKSGDVSTENISAYFDNKLDDLQTVKETDSILKAIEEKRGVSTEEAGFLLDAEIERRGG